MNRRPAALLTALLALAVPLAAQQSGYPLILEDATGTPVRIAEKPSRIVSLTLMTDEILVDLLGPEDLLAVTRLADDPGISNVAGRVDPVPHRMTLNTERLLALRPDLVLAAAWSNPDVVTQARRAGLTLYLAPSPTTFAEVRQLIETVARIVGARREGDLLVARMEAALSEVRQRVAPIPAEGRLTVIDYTPGGTAFGEGSSWDEVVEKAGLINAAARLGSDRWGNVPISQEQLLRLDPDIIVLPGWFWGEENGAERFRERFVSDPAFSVLRAVRNDRVMVATERLRLSTTHYMAEAVRELAEFAYPERFR